MYTRDNRFVRILTIALIACFALVVVQQVVIMIVGGRTAQAQGDLSSLQSQVADAQSQNSQMQQQYDEKLIEWRNAQGRLSFLGDGSGKVAYLTFDDGPSKTLTQKNLDILKEKGAVATWFCLANDQTYTYLDLNLCKTIEEQGNAVGIHDWDQNDSYSYYKGSVDDYFTTDFDKT